MHALRTIRTARLLVSLMVVSLLPAVLAPVIRAGSPGEIASYPDWLKSQLTAPAGAAFNTALAQAADLAPPSFEAFLVAFIEAYNESAEDEGLAEDFGAKGLSHDDLLRYLQGRYQRLLATVVLSRSALVATTTQATTAPERGPAPYGQRYAVPLLPPLAYSAPSPQDDRAFVRPVRSLSAAQPLGP